MLHNMPACDCSTALARNAAYGGTGGTIVEDLKQQAIVARAKRIETNRAKSCKACQTNQPDLVQLKPPDST
jgi:hypothetical protein